MGLCTGELLFAGDFELSYGREDLLNFTSWSLGVFMESYADNE